MFQRKIIEFFHCALKGKKSSNHCSHTLESKTRLVQCKFKPENGSWATATNAKSIIKQGSSFNPCLFDRHNPHYYYPPNRPHDLIFLCRL